MTEVHVKDELGSLDLTVVRLEGKPVESWTVEVRDRNSFIEMKIEDLDNLKSKVEEMVEQAEEADLE